MSSDPKYRWRLNKEQVEVLVLLYRFRFASSELVAQYFGKQSGVFAYKRLRILQEQGFIGKRFNSSYRIQGKPAAYYLTPKGARELQKQQATDRQDGLNIKGLYKEKTVSESFVAHCLDVLAVYNRLRVEYGEQLRFFTKSDFASLDYFPKQCPDAYVRIKNADDAQFFLDIFHDAQPYFSVIRKVKTYIEYAESGEWEATGSNLPVILLVCESPSLQKRLRKSVISSLGASWGEGPIFALTTKAELIAGEDNIWRLADDPEKTVALGSIQ